MSLKRFYRFSSILVSALILSVHTYACGPYPPIIPTPKFFTSNWEGLLSRNANKQENLQLWQKLTSEDIPLRDIEQAVYKDSSDKYNEVRHSNKKNDPNIFYVYLLNTEDDEIFDFLFTAKKMEEQWAKIRSPWYYPSSRNDNDDTDELRWIINKSTRYKGTRMKDRYALQAVRALFASRQYEKCINYFDESFHDFSDSNLFKRMALGYVAGCWYRLGETDKANEYFAQTGDLMSIKSDDPIAYMAAHNPDCPELMKHIQSLADDSAKFCAIRPIAEQLLDGNKVKNRGDWQFALAYMYGEFYADTRTASKYIHQAIRQKFSSDDLRDHARAYRIKIDAGNGVYESLLSELKWMESKINMTSPNANEWNRMMQNIVYVDLIPELWKKNDYTTAILLCGYADNLIHSKRDIKVCDFSTYDHGYDIYSLNLDDFRKSERLFNTIDYRSLSFQLMGSLSSEQLIKFNQRLSSGSPLVTYLKKYARTDSDYINELIGTLALREENYQLAVKYFAAVSDGYQRTMNVYKEDCLKKDPFYCPWSKNEQGKWEYRTYGQNRLEDTESIKYRFAKKMLALQNQMKYGKTADERGIARLKYAIGRYNSLEECWALTQYWRGTYMGLFEPMYYHDDNAYIKSYDKILYDYVKTVGYEKTRAIYETEAKAAIEMIQSDEVKAEAEYMAGNLITVVIKYGNTEAAQHIKTSCDNWQTWL